MSFAVWLTGLSGSGKSAIAAALREALHARGVDAAVLESDVLRTQLTPFARYDEADRDFFYATLAHLGSHVVMQGRPVVFDATANRRAYRDRARAGIARFAEVFVDTPLEVCAARDPKGLYRAGQTTTLPGLQAPYEPPLAPELVVRGDVGTPADGAARIVALLERRGWLAPGADLYQAIVEQGREAMIFADREGIILLWNARAEEIFGHACADAAGQSLDLIIPQHLRAAHWQGYQRAIAAGRTRSEGRPMLTRATHKDGSKLYVEVAFAIVTDERNAVVGALATARTSTKQE